jgi:glycosyltransferase involved in cell wall biosynthesis
LCQPGANETLELPGGTSAVQLALRVYGSGTTRISGVLLDHVREIPEVLFGRGDYLLVTNRYPSYDDLYRNGFVHRRVVEYAKQGLRVDVFRMGKTERVLYDEFEGVDVISGGSAALEALLRSNSYQAILVHFMDQRMWQGIRPMLDRTRLLIWAHGAEIQAWHRREAHFGSAGQLAAAKADAEPRREFWRQLLQDLPEGSKLVFVSRHFAEEVMSDLDLRLPQERYSVIHNVIDTSLFEYREKSAEQRLRVLSIRPYTSRIYGNDLTVAAILALTEHPFFGELRFHLVGDGPLFEETVAPLRGLPNVQLDQRFLSQAEIAEMHGNYGVFLCPTRGDTQGVSRDEAMSSGLVPVTNRAGAIPEFVDSHSGILAEREDALGLASGIARLYADPQLFLELSAGAARRVRAQSGPDQTTALELALIRGSR